MATLRLSNPVDEAAVLVVGGGIVGLSAALFLRGHGVEVTLVERHPAPSRLPRGRLLTPRTMELFRTIGLEERLRAAPPSVFRDWPGYARAETMNGRQYAGGTRPAAATVKAFSPCEPLLVDQSEIEPILLDAAAERGVNLRHNTELTGFTRADQQVRAELVDRVTGKSDVLRARHLIAADGHRSLLRKALGIDVHHTTRPTPMANIAFVADLTGPLRGRRLALCYVERPESNTLLARMDWGNRWTLMVPYHPQRGQDADRFTREYCLGLIRSAVGVSDLPADVLPVYPGETRLVHTWELAAWVADRYQDRQIYLCGDAAHVFPPAGGFGANTGIQDAHNLAWKLAAALSGTAGPELLDSYGLERRPVAELTAACCTQRLRERTGVADDMPVAVDPVAVSIGYQYRSPAVLGEPVDAPAAWQPSELTAQPGTRVPHVSVRLGGTEMSTLDLVRQRFTLFVGEDGTDWYEPAQGASSEVDTALDVLRVGDDFVPDWERWNATYRLGRTGAILVRPDGFVGWRADEPTGQRLRDVLARLLGHPVRDRVEPASTAQ